MFYDIFESLCRQKGVSPNRACIEMGLSRSVAAKWKNTKTSPSLDVLTKVVDYFGISADFLLNGEKKENPAAFCNGVYVNDIELIELIDIIKKLPKQRWLEVKGIISHMLYEEGAADAAKQISDHLA